MGIWFNDPHGYDLTLKDGREILIDISVKSDMKHIHNKGSSVFYDDTEIEDVYDCETEDHLVPYAWAEDESIPEEK